MLRKYVKVLLFLSSYFPLFIIVMIRNYQQSEILYFFGILIIGTSGFLIYVFSKANQHTGFFLEKGNVEDVSRISLQYFLTYVVPFLTMDFLKITDIASFAVVFFVIGIIYLRTDLIYMNPTLNIIGFSIYKVKTDENEYVVISKSKKAKIFTEPVIDLSMNVLLGLRHGGHAISGNKLSK